MHGFEGRACVEDSGVVVELSSCSTALDPCRPLSRSPTFTYAHTHTRTNKQQARGMSEHLLL